MLEMAAPVDPARAWPRAGRAGPVSGVDAFESALGW